MQCFYLQERVHRPLNVMCCTWNVGNAGLGVGDGALIGNVRKEGKNDQLITFLFVIELRVSQFSAGGLRLDTGFFTVSSHEAPPDDSVCCLQITSPSSVD
eukprot:scaffold214352_cov21-Tisochrysis_lutea.AAC.1